MTIIAQNQETSALTSEIDTYLIIDNLRVVFNQASDGTIESVTLFQNSHEMVAPRID
ncbi:MAG: hypothetical protein VKK42_04310 [Lyngbya sp.]|nr:hypothetical protein [Lyngbya sp.]